MADTDDSDSRTTPSEVTTSVSFAQNSDEGATFSGEERGIQLFPEVSLPEGFIPEPVSLLPQDTTPSVSPDTTPSRPPTSDD